MSRSKRQKGRFTAPGWFIIPSSSARRQYETIATFN